MGNCCHAEGARSRDEALTLEDSGVILANDSPVPKLPSPVPMNNLKSAAEAPALDKGAVLAAPAAAAKLEAAAAEPRGRCDAKLVDDGCPLGFVGSQTQDQMWSEFLAKHPSHKEAPLLGSIPRRPSGDLSLQEYTDKHKDKFDRVLDLAKPDGWTLKQENTGVKCYTKYIDGCRLAYFKGVADIESPNLAALLKGLFTTEDRPKWDEMCVVAESKHAIQPHYKYIYVQVKPPSPVVSSRDMISIGRFRFEGPDSCVVCLQSCELAEYPERSSLVRMNFIEGGYFIKAKGPGVFEVTWTGCVDPAGWVPAWVVNLAVVKQALTLVKLRAHVLSTLAR